MKTRILLSSRYPNFIYVDNDRLVIQESQLLRNYSSEFNWGKSVAGSAQTALAICHRLFGPYIALAVHQDFKNDFVLDWVDAKEYEIDLQPFYNERIEPRMNDIIKDYGHHILSSLATFPGVKVGKVLIDGFTIKVQASGNVSLIAQFCKSNNSTFAQIDGIWYVVSNFWPTDTLVALSIERAISMTTSAFSDLTGAFKSAYEMAAKIF